MLAFY